MSMRRLSPTANLLRTSRLFSLPPPLPRPISELSGTVPESDTATLPYPTHAAIETSDRAFQKGDWGLKRPLPSKSTSRSSTSHIQVENVDSIDHITDFGSTSAYTKTLEKWQEMDLSMSRAGRTNKEPLRSVFEPDFDNTDSRKRPGDEERWRFEGPWLKGQTQGEFTQYIDKNVKKRRSEFRRYLRKELARNKSSNQRNRLIEDGAGAEALARVEPVSDKELEYYINELRRQPSKLYEKVEEFLDLPRQPSQLASNLNIDISESGPPLTHPSAGISYLRSHSHAFNHPTYGPQDHKAPVEARVLTPTTDARGREQLQPIFGVAGVVTQGGHKIFPGRPRQREKAASIFDPDAHGGTKMWLQVNKAGVDPQGHIELGVQEAQDNAMLAKGVVETASLPEAAIKGANTTSMPNLSKSSSGESDRKQTYGLPDFGAMRKREEVRPLEDGEELMPALERSMRRQDRSF